MSLNFGHDASFSYFENGTLIEFSELERESGLKHQLGVTSKEIYDFLKRVKIKFDEVDIVAVSGTQAWGLFHSDDIKIEYNSIEITKKFDLYFTTWNNKRKVYFPGLENLKSIYNNQVISRKLVSSPSPVRVNWNCPSQIGLNNNYENIKNIFNKYIDSPYNDIKLFQSNFFDPLSITINGIKKPGFYVDHHISHAYYAGYYSSHDTLVATLDGGTDIAPFIPGGIYWFTKTNGVLPISSHRLPLGAIYDVIASNFGLDSGKLMGLSSYAYPNELIYETLQFFKNMYQSGKDIPEHFIAEKIKLSACLSNDRFIDRNNSDKFKFRFNDKDFAIQTAANTQYFVQEAYISIIGKFCARICEIMPSLKTIYTTGGFSLNCPTNTLLNQIYPRLDFIPLPGIGDTGLSIGAAAAISYFLDIKLSASKHNPAFPPSSLNSSIKGNYFNKLVKVKDNETEIKNFLTEKLLEGKIICRHSKRSEVGPRALGRRSIIAWAGNEMIRDTINQNKGREYWRPLAPICLLEDYSDYFIGDPNKCEYMLSISKVRSKDIPAVTHVDNTARVQIIDFDAEEMDNELCKLLQNIKQKSFAPVLVNTSFNCANEPIVETIEDAARSFIKMNFDYLWTDEGLFTKK